MLTMFRFVRFSFHLRLLSPLGSNRSAALLQLSKVTKALQDAETCIRLRPDWEKGYFRKGSVLQHQGKAEEVTSPTEPRRTTPHQEGFVFAMGHEGLAWFRGCLRGVPGRRNASSGRKPILIVVFVALFLFALGTTLARVAQALDAYKEAAQHNPNSIDVANKVKSLTRLVLKQKRMAENEAKKNTNAAEQNGSEDA